VDYEGIMYEFSAEAYHSESSPDMPGWMLVSLPKDLAVEIRDNFKWREQGWGRMRITARIGSTKWQTAIWFDTKQDTYLLPLKAEIRKKEHITCGSDVNAIIWV